MGIYTQVPCGDAVGVAVGLLLTLIVAVLLVIKAMKI